MRLFAVKIFGDKISFNSSRMAPAEAGINKEKEKLKALMGDSPIRMAENIVPPLRDTPGRRARA